MYFSTISLSSKSIYFQSNYPLLYAILYISNIIQDLSRLFYLSYINLSFYLNNITSFLIYIFIKQYSYSNLFIWIRNISKNHKHLFDVDLCINAMIKKSEPNSIHLYLIIKYLISILS